MNDRIFQETISKSNELLKVIADELGWDGRKDQAYDALRAVLHALRDRLPPEEAVKLSAQLPILIKGVYFDSWDPEETPIKMSKEEFLGRIRQQFVFDIEQSMEDMVRVVLDAIFSMTDPHESAKVKKALPPEIAGLFD